MLARSSDARAGWAMGSRAAFRERSCLGPASLLPSEDRPVVRSRPAGDAMLTPKLSYDAAEHVVSVENAGVSLETKKDIKTFFDACRSFWREHCGGKKA